MDTVGIGFFFEDLPLGKKFKSIKINIAKKNIKSGGSNLKKRRIKKYFKFILPLDFFSLSSIEVIKKPLMVKKIITPVDPEYKL